MSTQESGIRREGSALGIGALPNQDPSVSSDAEKSMRRYLWNPFHDINLVGPNGLLIRLGHGRSYYGQGRPGETYEDYQKRGGNLLLRCVAYPCDNIQYNDTLTNLGKPDVNQFNSGSGNDLGQTSGQEEVTIHAGVCAADMVNQYGVAARQGGEERGSYGLRDLKPIAGMMDTDTVAELFNIVQPYAWKLTNLRQEERGGLTDEETLLYDLADRGPAEERIKGANLEPALERIAEALRKMMLGGVRDAATKARFDYFDLDKQLKNAALGKIGFKSIPSPYDAHVCFLIGEPVPSAVARPSTGSDPDMKAAVNLLTQFVTGNQPPEAAGESVAEMKEVLKQTRAAITRMEKLKAELDERGAASEE